MASIAVTLPILPKFRVKLEPITNQTPRRVKSTVKPVLVQDGAGVKLRRSIGSSALSDLDPFLLLDEFGSSDVRISGFFSHFCIALCSYHNIIADALVSLSEYVFASPRITCTVFLHTLIEAWRL